MLKRKEEARALRRASRMAHFLGGGKTRPGLSGSGKKEARVKRERKSLLSSDGRGGKKGRKKKESLPTTR